MVFFLRSFVLYMILFFIPFVVYAESLDYLSSPVSGRGAPEEQGWAGVLRGKAAGRLVVEGTVPEWRIVGGQGQARWARTPDAADNEQGQKYGWQLITEMRLEKGGSLTAYYANGRTRFMPVISINEKNELQVAFEGMKKPVVIATGDEAFVWHRYDIVFYPGPRSSAGFYIDGRLVKDQWTGQESKENIVSWGTGTESVNGEGFVRRVHFEVHGDMVFSAPDRIPSVMVSAKTPGTVVLFAERREGGGDPGSVKNTNNIIARVSSNFGGEWSNEINVTEKVNADRKFDFSDPRPILIHDEDKILVSYARWPTDAGQALVSEDYGRIEPWKPGGVMYSVYDITNGLWSDPVDVSDQVKEKSLQIVGWGGSEIYERESGVSKSDRWSLEASLKIYNGDGNVVFVSDGDKDYRVTYAVDDRKNLTVRLNGRDQAIAIQPGKSRGATIFETRISYDPSEGMARLSLDGEEIAVWAGVPASERKIGFGQASDTQDGRMHISVLRLEKNGVPVIELDARALAVLDPAYHVREPEKLGWTKVVTGNAYSLYGVASVNPGPGHGIELNHQRAEQGGHNGRLIYPAVILDGRLFSVAAVYSDDQGKTWSIGADLSVPYRATSEVLEILQPSESDLVERKDGCLLMTARLDLGRVVEGVNYGPRRQFVSCDGGLTWNTPESYDGTQFSEISWGSVDASITRFVENNGESYLLFINPMGKEEDKKALDRMTVWGGRDNLGIWFSFDEGQSWKGPIQIVDGNSAYSDLYQIDGERAMVIFEDNKDGIRTMCLSIPLLKEKMRNM